MSKPRIETDATRAAREGATKEIGKDAHGKAVHALDLIDPQGNLVEAPIGTELKPGWRYATDKDRKDKAAAEAKRKASESSSAAPAAPASKKDKEPTPAA